MKTSQKPTAFEIVIGLLILIGMVLPLVDWYQHPEYTQEDVFQEWKWVIISTFLLAIFMRFRGYAN